MEILGLVFGGSSVLVGVAGLGIKGLSWLRSIDAQISALRLSQAEGEHNCQARLAEITAQLALIQGQLELARAISSSPRYRAKGDPIE